MVDEKFIKFSNQKPTNNPKLENDQKEGKNDQKSRFFEERRTRLLQRVF